MKTKKSVNSINLNFKGVNIEDCKTVANLIGIKVFVNEFIAYSELGKIINLRNNITNYNMFDSYRNGTLKLPNDALMIWNVIKKNLIH